MDAKERERQTRARRALAEVVGSGGAKMDELPLVPLDGMTNRNYKITAGGVNYVVRIPGEGTEEYVNRPKMLQSIRLNVLHKHREPSPASPPARRFDWLSA